MRGTQVVEIEDAIAQNVGECIVLPVLSGEILQVFRDFSCEGTLTGS